MLCSGLGLIAINQIQLFSTGTRINLARTDHGRTVCYRLDYLLDGSINLRLGNRSSYLLGNLTFFKDD